MGTGARRRAEEVEQGGDLVGLPGGAGHLHVQRAEPQRREGLGAVAVQLPCEVVGGILGPRHPHLADGELLERLPRLNEAGDMVPVLVGGEQQIDLAAGRDDDVGHHLVHRGRCFRRAEYHAAIDHDEVLAARLRRQGDQEAIAQAVAVHAHLRAVALACRARGAPGRGGLRRWASRGGLARGAGHGRSSSQTTRCRAAKGSAAARAAP